MKNLILGLALIVPAITFSQINFSDDFSVELSRPYDVVDAAVKEYFPVKDGQQILSLKIAQEMVTVQLFDIMGMKESDRREYKDFPKYSKIIDVVYFDDESFFYLYEVYNKSEKTYSVFKRQILVDEPGLGKPVELFKTKRAVSVNMGGQIKLGVSSGNHNMSKPINLHFYVNQSFDKSKLLISYRLKPKSRNDDQNKDEIGMFVFNQDMELIWGKEITMPYTEAIMNNIAYGTGNKGNGLLMIQKTDTKKYELLSFSDEDLTIFELDIEDDVMFQRFVINEDNEGNYVFSGLYANGVDYRVNIASGINGQISPINNDVTGHFNTDGLYVYSMSKNGEFISKDEYSFELDFIGLYLSEKQKKKLAKREEKGVAGISDLRIGNIHINNDGSKVFICERQWEEKRYNPATNRSVPLYNYTNMVIMKISRDGTLEWINKLPKRQQGGHPVGGMSYKYIHGIENHFVIFMDNPKNAELDAQSVPEQRIDGKGGYLTAFEVADNNGSVTKHLLLDASDLKGKKIYQFNINRVFDGISGTFFTEVYLKKKMDGMIKMILK